jgi:hypothetical protein
MTASEQQRMARAIEELSSRIARLAIGLGVSLKTDTEVAHAMNHRAAVAVPQERRATTERRDASRTRNTADRRQSHLYEELRGLLVMRYDMETHYVEVVGAFATRQILVESEAHLARDGFQPGTTGIDLDRLFKDN